MPDQQKDRQRIQVSAHLKVGNYPTRKQENAAIAALGRMVKMAETSPINGFQNAVTFVWDHERKNLLIFQEVRQFPPEHVTSV